MPSPEQMALSKRSLTQPTVCQLPFSWKQASSKAGGGGGGHNDPRPRPDNMKYSILRFLDQNFLCMNGAVVFQISVNVLNVQENE